MSNPVTPDVNAVPATSEANPPATPTATAQTAGEATERSHQRAYLLQQVMDSPEQQLAKGKANRFPRAVRSRTHLAPGFGECVRRPRRSGGVARRVGRDGGAPREHEEHQEAGRRCEVRAWRVRATRGTRAGGRKPGDARAQPNLMSAVPSYLPPRVSRKVILSCPGSVARMANEKNGFSLTDWVVSKAATCFPR